MDNRSIDLILTSGKEKDKRVIEISKSSKYKLTSIEGIESSDIDLSLTDNSQYDGKVVNSKRISGRTIDIAAEYVGGEFQKVREDLISFFNPKNEGCLKVILREDDKKVVREINYEIENFKIVQDNIYSPLAFKISIICPDPFFKDEHSTEKIIAVWEGGVKFPFKFDLKFKHKTKDEEKKGVILRVNGHIETPVEIEFEGPAKNPCVKNATTNEFIKVKRDILEGEVLFINTAYGNKKVIIKSEGKNKNAFNYIDLNSTFFTLRPGDNLIQYFNDDVKLTEQNVKIKYKNNYLGI